MKDGAGGVAVSEEVPDVSTTILALECLREPPSDSSLRPVRVKLTLAGKPESGFEY